MNQKKYFRTLTIAGSDSGGGAGIQADIKTFSALGCYGMSVITALTAQNTLEVKDIYDVPPKFIESQFRAILDDIGVDAVKIGMLHTAATIKTISTLLKEYQISKIILDPVMFAKAGDALLKQEALLALKEELIPMALILTPNLPEAEVLLNRSILTRNDMEKAAKDLHELGPQSIFLKGGHREGDMCSDILYSEKTSYWLESKRIETSNSHGTGCTLSSALASYIAKGLDVLTASRLANQYVFNAIKMGADYKLGKGYGPVHHFFKSWDYME